MTEWEMTLKVHHSHMMLHLISHSKIVSRQLFHVINLIRLHKRAFFFYNLVSVVLEIGKECLEIFKVLMVH